MFGVVIKNSILVFLIILIIHFFIKNNSLECAIKETVRSNKPIKKTVIKKDDECLSDKIKADDCIKYEIDNNMKIDLGDKVKELYDFVYADASAKEDLDEYYEEKNITKIDEKLTNENISEDLKYVKMCESAKNPITEHNKKLEMTPEVKQNSNTKNDGDNIDLVNTFLNEKSINGGKIYNDMELYGWDCKNANYSSL